MGWMRIRPPRDQAFCTYAIMKPEPLIVLDDRFNDNPLVTAKLGIRFYAGAPLVSPDNFRLGTFCIIDTKPRDSFHGFERNNLIDFATTTVDIIEMRKRLLLENDRPIAAE
jgi:GAF domain-containing protein